MNPVKSQFEINAKTVKASILKSEEPQSMMRKSLATIFLVVLTFGRVVSKDVAPLGLGGGGQKGNETFSGSLGDPGHCVQEVMRRLSLDKFNHTDPLLLQDILLKDMYLLDVEASGEILDSVKFLLGDALTMEKPLVPMITSVRETIENEHPMIVEFLCRALEEELIPEVKETGDEEGVIARSVHHAYLLDAITMEMASDWHFMVEIKDHLLAIRETIGLPTDLMSFVCTLYALTGQLFEPIKAKTMDWIFEEKTRILERGQILPSEVDALISGLSFNILEACIAENLNGYEDNAMAGMTLYLNPAETVRMDGDKLFLEIELSLNWIKLYESWNLAFITGNVQYLNLLYPKLLIPAVINAAPRNYMFRRAVALWLSANFFLFAQALQKPDHPIPNEHALTQLWGSINREHAAELMLEWKNEPLDNYKYLLGISYDMLWDQLKHFFVSGGVMSLEDAAKLSTLLDGTDMCYQDEVAQDAAMMRSLFSFKPLLWSNQ